jgi:hypothetical protein
MKRCYRCGLHIMASERSATALIGGTSVNMHDRCHDEWLKEELADELQAPEEEEAPAAEEAQQVRRA